jgi:hypothetical protein
MARISVNANEQVIAGGNNVAGAGMDVVFGGVEVFEVRARELGWRRVVIAAGLATMVGLTAFAWGRVSVDDPTPTPFWQASLVTCMTLLYGMFGIRQTGVVWRFDHKRKTITRRHWMRGMSREWNSKLVSGVRVMDLKSRVRGDLARLALVNAGGDVVAEIGAWDKARVDLGQVQAVVGEIKKVMWWK